MSGRCNRLASWIHLLPDLRTLVVLATLLLSQPAQLHAQYKGEGPASLLLFYRCMPESRSAFRSHMAGPGVARFETWKKERAFQDYLILFSTYVNPNWDMLVRLDFEKYVDSDKWNVIERTAPAGLSPEGLALCSPVDSQLADPMWQKENPSRDVSKARYLVVPFLWTQNSRARYLTYFEARPKYDLDAWVSDGGVLSAYDVFVIQLQTGAKWQALWMLEYRDTVALARREVVKQHLRRDKLVAEDNPAYKFARQTANESHATDPAVVADRILPR